MLKYKIFCTTFFILYNKHTIDTRMDAKVSHLKPKPKNWKIKLNLI